MINGNACTTEIFNWLRDLDAMWYEISPSNVEKKIVSLPDISLLILNDAIYLLFKKHIFNLFVLKTLSNNFTK